MRSVLNYPGSKKRIASWIIKHMPPHHSYLEPYFGCGAVLFAKQPAPIETVNDLDGEVVNFFRVIRDPESREKLQEWIAYTPYARQVYDDVFLREPEDEVERAACFAVKSMQSHGFRMTRDSGGWKKDVNGREYAYAVRYWNELPECIAEMAIRLKQVQIENRPALELIKAFNHENVLIYADPPYVLSTRSRKQYRHEMEDSDHEELLETVLQSQARIMISGYESEMYNDYLQGWRKVHFTSCAEGGRRRQEVVWMNYECGAQMALGGSK